MARGLPRPYQLAGRSIEWVAAAACVVTLVAVFLADVLTPAYVLLSALALLPILLAVWTMSARPALTVTVIACTLLVAEPLLGSSAPVTVGVEIVVYMALAVAARLHAHRVAVAISSVLRGADPAGISNLTRREREVISLAANGYTAAEIGDLLHIGERTVESHLANAYPKLGVRSKLELMRQAALLGVEAAP